MRESAEAVKDSIKQEMNAPKSGKLNRKTGRRRSAAGEGLAKDTGDALSRLTSISSGFNSIDVGFERGDNEYMKEWENSRPHKSHDEKQRDRQIMDKPFERVR